MNPWRRSSGTTSSRWYVERLALGGITLATVALGALSLWAAIATQNAAQGLSQAGVQTSGHLRAVQAATKIDTQSDVLEDGVEPESVAVLRNAQRILDESLERMEHGDVPEAAAVAHAAKPIVRRLKPEIEYFLDEARSGDPERAETAGDAANDILEQLQITLGDLETDPSHLLTTKLEEVTSLERMVRKAAIVLVPFGLGFVLLCAWLITRSARALVRSQEQLQLAHQIARSGSWDFDLRDGTVMWSTALRDVMAVGPDVESSYDNWLGFVHEDDRDWLRPFVDEGIARGGDFEYEYRHVCPDGSTRWLLTRARSIHDRGRPVRAVGATTDITERHEADAERDSLELQLRQAQRLEAVGRLAGGVAHDFNNLLLGIRGYGELALDGVERGERPVEEIGEIISAADRAGALTSQLLAFSRRQVLQPEIIDVNDIVRGTNGLLHRLIGEDIEVVTLESDAPVYVNADAGQLEQVLMNLAVNARDAMPSGGNLTLEVAWTDLNDEHGLEVEPGRYAVLAVTDSGCGMDRETVSQVFEPFYTTKADGTGLGLSTVHGIVKQSGGSIWVYSEVGHGTTFKIYLPLADQPAAVEAGPPAPRAPNGTGQTIVVVEDDERVRGAISRMLDVRGYRVVTAESSADALTLAAEPDTEIDLLLTDLVMPGVDGRAVASRFRELHPHTAVLYMSGYTDDTVIRRGEIGPRSGFLQKPFSSDELGRRIEELLAAVPALAANGDAPPQSLAS